MLTVRADPLKPYIRVAQRHSQKFAKDVVQFGNGQLVFGGKLRSVCRFGKEIGKLNVSAVAVNDLGRAAFAENGYEFILQPVLREHQGHGRGAFFDRKAQIRAELPPRVGIVIGITGVCGSNQAFHLVRVGGGGVGTADSVQSLCSPFSVVLIAVPCGQNRFGAFDASIKFIRIAPDSGQRRPGPRNRISK